VAASPMLAQGQGLLALVLAGFQSPALLVQAGAVYVLAFVMYVTRRMDWYELKLRNGGPRTEL